MKKSYLTLSGRRIVVVSTFSGMDLFLLGCLKAGVIPGYAVEMNFWASLMHAANFKHPDGTPVIEFVNINLTEYNEMKSHTDKDGKKDQEDFCGIIDGQHVRTKSIEEVNGYEIRKSIEERYGEDVIILFIGGPPCTDFTKVNKKQRVGAKNRNKLVFQFLRVLTELNADLAIMEEVTDFGSPKHKPIYDEFYARATKLPYRIAENDMCSLHYGGHQMRWRKIIQFVHNDWNAKPVFPEPDLVNVKRVKDFLDIDYFFSGHFTDSIKTNNHFMCTVTSGSPLWFSKDGKKFPPSIDDLLLCMDVEKGDYYIPPSVPKDQVKKAIGNGVCLAVGTALVKTIIEKVLKLKPAGNGFFIPIDSNPDDPDDLPRNSDDPNDPENPPVSLDNGQKVEDISPTEIFPSENLIVENANSNDVELFSDPSIQNYDTELTTSMENKPMKFYETGFVLYEGKSKFDDNNIVVILTLKSVNEKTGNMAQLWILTADIDPLEAVKSGKDYSICEDCTHRHSKDGACYVYVGKEPYTVWNAWKNGAYPKLSIQYYHQLTGLSIRFGAYGDPAAMPINILQELKKVAKNYTGYTHQWKRDSAAELKSLCMASVDNEKEYHEAKAMGWRTFRIRREHDSNLDGEILCPNLTAGVKCIDCTLCKGASIKAKNIVIPVHGQRKTKFKNEHFEKEDKLEQTAPLRNICLTDSNSNKIDAPKIISSTELQNMQFESLDFDGRWNVFLGYPSTTFHAIIHGMSGHGKSTFAIQFAKYLADKFGRVLYISGEEGFSMTFKDKFVNNQADSISLDVADLRSMGDVLELVSTKAYNFIFFDSLDTMKINADALKKIRIHFKNSALITISQSTKSGLIRGSYEIVHDSDIVIRVEDGSAETTKNRFKEKGMTFRVFDHDANSTDKNERASEDGKENYKTRSSLTQQGSIVELERQLNEALAEENFEIASELRDKIERLKKIRNDF